jgi:3D (Asp-Asp-Asp) domain-containing protein
MIGGDRVRRAALRSAVAIAAAVPAVAVLGPRLAGALGAPAAAADSASSSPSGGAGLGGLAPTSRPRHVPPPPSKHARGRWLSNFVVTEYWPAPERWFVGKLVRTPGVSTRHRIDWLYSAMGVSMEGEGLALDGRMYHIDALGNGGWVTVDGAATSPADGWRAGPPYWRAGAYWKNRHGGVTFPLQRRGWSAGRGRSYVPLPGVSFAKGASLPLRFYRSIAVDPSVIPLGSRVYVPAYRHDGYGGWFVAQDTGGAIGGNHIDVYRSPPASSNGTGNYLTGQRVYVIKPRR